MAAIIEEIEHSLYYRFDFSAGDVQGFSNLDTCPTCGVAAPFNDILELGQEDWPARLRLVQCHECDAVFYENPPGYDFVQSYYKSGWNKQRGETSAQTIRSRTRAKTRLAEFVTKIGYANSSARILDIGCGLGDLMAGFAKYGFENVYGTEMAPYRIAMSEARFPGRIFRGGYEAVPDDLRFDLIYSNHVVEHLPQPGAAFKWMVDHLNPDGFIVITVPDSWSEPVFYQVLGLPHLHSFCAQSFQCLAERNSMAARFWPGDRRWDLSCVFSRDFSRFNDKQGLLVPFDNLRRNKAGSLVERIREPWLGESADPCYHSLRPFYKIGTDHDRLTGYRQLTGGQYQISRLALMLARFFQKVLLLNRFNVKPRNLGHMRVKPQLRTNNGKPLVVGAANGRGLLELQ